MFFAMTPRQVVSLMTLIFALWLPPAHTFTSSLGSIKGRVSEYPMLSASSSQSFKKKKQKRTKQTTTRDTLTSRFKPKRKMWNDMMPKLKLFYQLHGHTLVSSEHNDPELLAWTNKIRYKYRYQVIQQDNAKGEPRENNSRPFLSEEKLNALGRVEFVWDIQELLWLRRFDELCFFQSKHGHIRVPVKSAEFPKLGVWLANQRRDYRNLMREGSSCATTTLTPARLEGLLSVVDVTEWTKKSHTNTWQKRYKELLDFYNTYGHANVPQDYSQNFELGQWIMNQRKEFKRYLAGQSTALDLERIELLSSIDFSWDQQRYKWYHQLERLKAYQKLHVNIDIDKEDTENSDLRQWVIRQRQEYNKILRAREEQDQDQQEPTNISSPLTAKRIQALQEVPGFRWSRRSLSSPEGPSTNDWAELFEKIKDKGIKPGMRPKEHWFEGENPFTEEVKEDYTDEDFQQLWNMEDDEGGTEREINLSV